MSLPVYFSLSSEFQMPFLVVITSFSLILDVVAYIFHIFPIESQMALAVFFFLFFFSFFLTSFNLISGVVAAFSTSSSLIPIGAACV